MMMMMMMMMIIIILKALFEIFYNLLTTRELSPTYAQAARAQSCANLVQHI